MLLWGKTAYGKIPVSERTLRGEGMRILVPRANELPALRPLIDMLEKETDVRQVEAVDARERVARTGARMAQKGIGKAHDQIRRSLFLLEDAWVRLAAIAGMLSDKSSAVLELRALDRDYSDGKGFRDPEGHRRLFGTRLLLREDAWVREFFDPLTDAFWLLSRSNGHGTALAGLFRCLDLHKIAREKDDLLGTLAEAQSRTAMVLVPAGRKKVRPPDGARPRTDFEKDILCYDSLPPTLAGDEMLSLLMMFQQRGRRGPDDGRDIQGNGPA